MTATIVKCQDCPFTRVASKTMAKTIAIVHRNVTGHQVRIG